MSGPRTGPMYVLAAALAVLAASRGAVAQTGISANANLAVPNTSASPAEYYEVGVPLTLEQVLARPDATKVMGSDCKQTTVGALRKLVSLGKKAPPKAVLGGAGKTVYALGASHASEANQLVKSISAAAQASRAAGGTTVRLNAITVAPGIGMVNGKAAGITVTPGAYLTIAGNGFGASMGQVNLIGSFPGGAAALTVGDWKTNSVWALLPEGVRGVLDQTVALQVVTFDRKTYRHDGVSFVATREDTTVKTNIPRLLRFQSGPSWGGTMDTDGSVMRSSGGESINCPAVGSDTLTLVDPGKGFVVTGLIADWTGRTDSGDGDYSGDPGSRTYTPGYGFGDWSGISISVRWGVFRSHTSPLGGGKSEDQCSSSYSISVTLNGPVGVSPF